MQAAKERYPISITQACQFVKGTGPEDLRTVGVPGIFPFGKKFMISLSSGVNWHEQEYTGSGEVSKYPTIMHTK